MKSFSLILLLFLSGFIFAAEKKTDSTKNAEIKATEEEKGFDQKHELLTTVLKNFVIQKGATSQVNYASLKETPQSLNTYLKQLQNIKQQDFQKWTDSQRMSFWINAYNGFTLKLIIDHYPVDSIKDIGGFFSSPWKKEFFKLFGKSFYLDKIEHEILRKRFKEPRIHFAVNCASIGCPALRTEAFYAEKLEEQLHEQTQLFLNDTSRNKVDKKNNKIYLSRIFKWFKEDFGTKDKKIIQYVFPFMKSDGDEIQNWLEFDLEYTSYDWDLNGVKN